MTQSPMQHRITRISAQARSAVYATLSALFSHPAPYRTANLPSSQHEPRRSNTAATVFWAVTAALAVFVIVAAFVGFGLVTLIVFVIAATVLAGSMLAVRRANRAWRTASDAHFVTGTNELRAHKPQFLVHFDGSREAVYQLEMWLPYLAQIALPYAVIVRRAESFDRVASAVQGAPVLLAEDALDAEQLLVSSATSVFYVNLADRNNQITRFEHLQHIQLGHGDSDKGSSATRTFRLFDRVYLAGQAGVDRFAEHGVRIDQNAIAIVGRPQVSGIEQSDQPVSSKQQPTLLYAPTWRGDFEATSHTSLPYAADLISLALEHGCRVVFRPHPYTWRYPSTADAAAEIDRRLSEHAATTGTDHVFGRRATHELSVKECFNLSDAMISDVSAVLSDYLYSGKPLGVFIPTTSAGVQNEGGCYLFTEDASSWAAQLVRLLKSDPLRGARIALRDHRLGNAAVAPPERLFVETARGDVLSPLPKR